MFVGLPSENGITAANRKKSASVLVSRPLRTSAPVSPVRFPDSRASRMWRALLVFYTVLRVSFASAMTVEAFKKHGVVPDVVPNAPTKKVSVKFDSGVEVQNPPKVSWEAEPGALYTLIKTEPKFREWHHWVVANIPGSEVGKGDVLSEYIGAGPPPDTGLHRYVYLVYKQTGRLEDKEHGHLGFSGDKRNNWKAAAFAAKHKLGDPVFGNFYQAQFDDYVPKLYEKLGG